MNQTQLNSFLTEMFNNPNEFLAVNGVTNSMDMKYMLAADAVSENIELLEEVLKEYLVDNFNKFNKIPDTSKEKIKSTRV